MWNMCRTHETRIRSLLKALIGLVLRMYPEGDFIQGIRRSLYILRMELAVANVHIKRKNNKMHCIR